MHNEIPQNRLYNDLAWLWPYVSAPADYAHEASIWNRALREKLGPGKHKLLELGVGGGNNLSHFAKEYNATAVDLSEGMLAHSKKLNPTVKHHVGDMRTIRLDENFDAVIIHDAITYMLTEDDLRETFKTVKYHLREGGVFITSPDYWKETFTDNMLYKHESSKDDLHLTFIEYVFDPDPKDTTFENIMVYFIRQKGSMRVELDRHIAGIFPLQCWLDLMDEAGFTVEKVSYDVHEDKRQSFLLVGILK